RKKGGLTSRPFLLYKGAAGAKKNCEIGVGFSFAALSVCRLRRAEAASAVWIPHWHSEPFESQGARAAKRYVNGNLVEREKHHLNLHLNLGVGCAPSCWPIFGFRTSWVLAGGTEGSFLCSLITDFLAEGAGWGASPGRGGELGCEAQQVLKKNCEIGVGFSFAALWVFRLRRAEAASAVWIPHWHSTRLPFTSTASPPAPLAIRKAPEREKGD